MFSIGMDGWWLDATEPEHSPAKEGDLDFQTYLGSFRKVRNAFPLVSVGAFMIIKDRRLPINAFLF